MPLRIAHPVAGHLRFHREALELPAADAQQVVVLLAADDATARGLEQLRRVGGRRVGAAAGG